MSSRTPIVAGMHLVLACFVGLAMENHALAMQKQIALTKHNLSATGPGSFKASGEGRLCVFCHAPHKTRKQVPLWNRDDSTQSYLTYSSSTFQGSVSQPNGSTKLCLSCHDGTIALGRVVSQAAEITMDPGARYLNTGTGFIGSNLQDDHPVSFNYGSSKGGSSPEFLPENSITPPVRLDGNGDVQCTSCHDAHDNSLGRFLRTTDKAGALCLSCHSPTDWSNASHRLSTSTWNNQGIDPWPNANYNNVADNACQNCHSPHGAGHPQRLLVRAKEEENCSNCHNGNVAAKNIMADIIKSSAHDVTSYNGIHDPVENPLSMSRHAECQDCHNPHAAKSGTAAAPGVPGPLLGVSGLDTNGSAVARISFGYELCYKCHADNPSGTNYVSRILAQTNVRLEFDQSNPSFHPIEAQGRNPDVPSLISPWTTSSRMSCTDCHGSNTSPRFGGSGPRGPHGSTNVPILGLRYTTGISVVESSSAYALCYKCHSRSSILGDQSFGDHDKHIRGENAPCSVCHDPHGVSSTQGNSTNNSHLINFDKNAVIPNMMGKLEFIDRGRFKGSCSLRCHGKNHKNKSY